MQLSRPASRYRQFTVWVVGAVLLLQLLAVLSTWQCSGQVHRASHSRPPFTSLLLWLSGHSICEAQAEEATIALEGVLEHRNSVRRQRPYAYAFCLTSVHHLCTALLNTVRLRKLQSFQVIMVRINLVWSANQHFWNQLGLVAILVLCQNAYIYADMLETAWMTSMLSA